MPLIQDYIAEHDHAVDVSADAVRAIDAGNLDRARTLLAELARDLKAHWKGEEDGLFSVLLDQELFEDHLRPLIREHRELEQLLAEVDLADPEDQARISEAVAELREHIIKEEDGIFPASLTALAGDEWDSAIAAWHAAHPGERMIQGT